MVVAFRAQPWNKKNHRESVDGFVQPANESEFCFCRQGATRHLRWDVELPKYVLESHNLISFASAQSDLVERFIAQGLVFVTGLQM